MIGLSGGPFSYLLTRFMRQRINQNSYVVYPGGVRLSSEKLRRLCPELFPSLLAPLSIAKWLFGSSMSAVYDIRDILLNGGSGPAVVIATSPLLIAPYSQNIDGVAMLRFPDELTAEYSLSKGSRLLTCLNVVLRGNQAPDLEHGPDSWHDSCNFIPLIAEFLSDDMEWIEKRKRGVEAQWWDKTQGLGQQYLEKHGTKARDGSPTKSWIPAV